MPSDARGRPLGHADSRPTTPVRARPGLVLLLTWFDKGRLGAKRQQAAIAVAYELLDDSKDRFR